MKETLFVIAVLVVGGLCFKAGHAAAWREVKPYVVQAVTDSYEEGLSAGYAACRGEKKFEYEPLYPSAVRKS